MRVYGICWLMERRLLSGLSPGLLLLISLLTVNSGLGQSMWLPREERVAVDISGDFITIEGKVVDLRSFEEDVLFLNFWATWCGPCRAEMPSIEKLQKELARRSFRVIAISDEDRSVVRSYMQEHSFDFTVLIDDGGSFANRLKIYTIPWTLILDKERKLVHFQQGARLWDTPNMVEAIKMVLEE